MTTEEQGGTGREALLIRQYELYVQMADHTSERRSKANAYYVSVTAAVLVLVARFGGIVPESRMQALGLILIAVLGMLVCLVWKANVTSFQQLNRAKFQVIHELESRLPFPVHDREWELLSRGTDRKSYLQLTKVEGALPLMLMVAYGALLLIAVAQLARLA